MHCGFVPIVLKSASLGETLHDLLQGLGETAKGSGLKANGWRASDS